MSTWIYEVWETQSTVLSCELKLSGFWTTWLGVEMPPGKYCHFMSPSWVDVMLHQPPRNGKAAAQVFRRGR